MQIDPEDGWLWPIVYPSEFWLLKEHLLPLDGNASVSEPLPLALSYAPIGFFKWQIQVRFWLGVVLVGVGMGWGWCLYECVYVVRCKMLIDTHNPPNTRAVFFF